jgi:outer membrane lipoprotein-sorting protein
VSADISFTDNLFSGSSIATPDPLVSGASGRLWAARGQLRLELQSTNGDGEIVVNHRRFWIYDPASDTVYQGNLPRQSQGGAGTDSETAGHVPTVAQIQRQLDRLGRHAHVSGARATDVGGQPAYSVTVTPRTGAGLIGGARLAFDANHALPLDFAVFSRGETSPALELRATDISYGAVPRSDFQISPPAGARVVQVAIPHRRIGTGRAGHHRDLQVVGRGLAGVVIARHAGGTGARSGSGEAGPLPLQSVTIDGASGRQLVTPLGTVLEFTRAGVDYLLAGAVTPAALDSVARGL